MMRVCGIGGEWRYRHQECVLSCEECYYTINLGLDEYMKERIKSRQPYPKTIYHNTISAASLKRFSFRMDLFRGRQLLVLH